jgi:hypothetical protein
VTPFAVGDAPESREEGLVPTQAALKAMPSGSTKETCPECNLLILTKGGRLIDHFIRGTERRCEGSGDLSLENVERVLAADTPKPKFQIDKSVPLPANWRGKYIDTIRAMEVGDSFVCSYGNNVSSMIHTAARRVGFKCVTRRVSQSELRVWRVE